MSTEKTSPAFSQGRLRYIFAFSFPLVLLLLIAMTIFDAFQTNMKQRQQKAEELLHENTKALMSLIQTNYSFARQLQKKLLQLSNRLADSFSQAEKDRDLREILFQCIPADLASNGRIWLFEKEHNDFVSLDISPFAGEKRKAMSRAFSSLVSISENTGANQMKNTFERFINGMFGENSAAEYLATERRGLLSPVIHEGRQHYLFWQKFIRNNNCSGGIIALFPGAMIEDQGASLERLSNEIFAENSGRYIAAFAGTEHNSGISPLILPDKLQNKAVINDLHRIAANIKPSLKQYRLRRLNEFGNYLVFTDYIAEDCPYHALIFVPKDTLPESLQVSRKQVAVLLGFSWLLFFGWKSRQRNFRLGFAFRLLFFLTGMLPVILLFLSGFRLIEQRHEADIVQRTEQKFAALDSLNEKTQALA